MNTARSVVQAREYALPPECATILQKWQKGFCGKSRTEPQTAYNIVFSDGNGDEVCAAPISFKNRSLSNIFFGAISHFSGHGSGSRVVCWYVTPMIHCDAAAFERWIGFDIPQDQLPNVKSVTVELAE